MAPREKAALHHPAALTDDNARILRIRVQRVTTARDEIEHPLPFIVFERGIRVRAHHFRLELLREEAAA